MAKNGSKTAPMTEAEARKRWKEAQRRAEKSPTRKARNAWRHVAKRREHLLHRIERREKLAREPHVVHHKHPPSPGFEYVIRGGNPDQRQIFAWRYAHHHARLHYSEPGLYLPGYFLTNVPSDDDRSDCSWGFLECRRVCGLPDFVHGDDVRYTETIRTHGREVSQHYAERHTGIAVLFGNPTFHVGMSVGSRVHPSDEIWQHGTPSFRKGTFGQFGAGTEVRYFAYAR